MREGDFVSAKQVIIRVTQFTVMVAVWQITALTVMAGGLQPITLGTALLAVLTSIFVAVCVTKAAASSRKAATLKGRPALTPTVMTNLYSIVALVLTCFLCVGLPEAWASQTVWDGLLPGYLFALPYIVGTGVILRKDYFSLAESRSKQS